MKHLISVSGLLLLVVTTMSLRGGSDDLDDDYKGDRTSISRELERILFTLCAILYERVLQSTLGPWRGTPSRERGQLFRDRFFFAFLQLCVPSSSPHQTSFLLQLSPQDKSPPRPPSKGAGRGSTGSSVTKSLKVVSGIA